MGVCYPFVTGNLKLDLTIGNWTKVLTPFAPFRGPLAREGEGPGGARRVAVAAGGL